MLGVLGMFCNQVSDVCVAWEGWSLVNSHLMLLPRIHKFASCSLVIDIHCTTSVDMTLLPQLFSYSTSLVCTMLDLTLPQCSR